MNMIKKLHEIMASRSATCILHYATRFLCSPNILIDTYLLENITLNNDRYIM